MMTTRGRWISVVMFASVLVVFFQNCQDFQISDEVLRSEGRYQEDQIALGQILSSAEFVGSYEAASFAGDSVATAAAGTQDLPNHLQNRLFPESSFSLGLASPSRKPTSVTEARTGRHLLLHAADGAGATVLQTSTQDNLFSDQFSVVLVVRQPAQGDILAIHSGVRGTEELRIGISDGNAIAYHFTDANNYSFVSVPLPAQEYLVIAASFGLAPNQLVIMVNGVSSQQVTTVGAPGDSAYVLRQFQLGPTMNGSRVTWGETQLFLKALGAYKLGVMSRYLATRWNIPDVIDDLTIRTGVPGGLTLNPAFIAAKAVIESKCVGCHATWSGKGANYYVSAGLIVPGSPESSKIYYRLSGSAGANGPKNMPQGGSLGAAEMSIIQNWIRAE